MRNYKGAKRAGELDCSGLLLTEWRILANRSRTIGGDCAATDEATDQ